MQLDLNNLEDSMFTYIDQFKALFSQDLWENILLNCTKNEIFILLHLYRQSDVNMSSIADYLEVPLNTATGIVSRMEKKQMISRVRSISDKRVVTIELTEDGSKQINLIMKEFFKYASQILSSFTVEEMKLIGKLMDKVVYLVNNLDEVQEKPKSQIRKITID